MASRSYTATVANETRTFTTVRENREYNFAVIVTPRRLVEEKKIVVKVAALVRNPATGAIEIGEKDGLRIEKVYGENLPEEILSFHSTEAAAAKAAKAAAGKEWNAAARVVRTVRTK